MNRSRKYQNSNFDVTTNAVTEAAGVMSMVCQALRASAKNQEGWEIVVRGVSSGKVKIQK
jgi:hypothetical protein